MLPELRLVNKILGTDLQEEQVDAEELRKIIQELLQTLEMREARIIELRFGLNDYQMKTLEQVGKDFFVTKERIRQIEAKALRRLRHPTRRKKIKEIIHII